MTLFLYHTHTHMVPYDKKMNRTMVCQDLQENQARRLIPIREVMVGQDFKKFF